MYIFKSPKYFGKNPSDYNLNDTEIGYDNNIWQVIIKNNRYERLEIMNKNLGLMSLNNPF